MGDFRYDYLEHLDNGYDLCIRDRVHSFQRCSTQVIFYQNSPNEAYALQDIGD